MDLPMLPRPRNLLHRLRLPSISLVICVICFIATKLSDEWILRLAATSGDLHLNRIFPLLCRLITYQFMHGGIGHFRGNFLVGLAPMIYLENKLGKLKFLAFYLLSGLFGGLAFLLIVGHTPFAHAFESLGVHLTLVGASGSIFGVFLYSLYLYSKESIYNALIAYIAIECVILPQVVDAINSLQMPVEVAYWGHVGSMLAAIPLMFLLKPCKKKQ